MKMFSFAFFNYFETRIICKRINHILKIPNEQKESDIFSNDENLKKGELVLKNASFSYNDDKFVEMVKKFEMFKKKTMKVKKDKLLAKNKIKETGEVLQEINLNIEPGKLIAIVGEIGSGKSSLLKAIMNSLIQTSGEYKKNGKIGYVP